MSIKPHGGALVNRILTGQAGEEALKRAEALPKLILDRWEVSDLELIANGAFSPLTGFMNKADYENVVNNIRLADGTVWSIPIVLGVTPQEAEQLAGGRGSTLQAKTEKGRITWRLTKPDGKEEVFEIHTQNI